MFLQASVYHAAQLEDRIATMCRVSVEMLISQGKEIREHKNGRRNHFP